VSAEQLSYLRELLSDAIEAGAECLACGGWPMDGRITICQHFFCQNWCVPLSLPRLAPLSFSRRRRRS